jgi:glucose-6-phosphate 1-dehydrogenase
VEASWSLIQPILDHWAKEGARGLLSYPAGSWGPPAADDLMAHHDWAWRNQ